MKLADEVGADGHLRHGPGLRPSWASPSRTGAGEWQLLTGNQIGCVLLHYILSSQARRWATLPGKDGAAVKSVVSTVAGAQDCRVLRRGAASRR